MSLFAELKRRNVLRVAAAYLALGWIVTQVTSTVAPALRLPDWVVPLVMWIGAIGFPFVLLFSWIYELTPEGIKKEAEVDRTQSITNQTGQRLDYVVIGLLVVAIGLFAFHEFRPANNRMTVVATAKPGPAGGAASGNTGDRSVAVLPFVDMSAAKNQDYFADGISEELLNLLAQVPQLRVIARTSSFSFKGKEVDIAEIARKLNVANILEGSVRTSGDKVRITAQLIRASDSSHIWSQTYDRELTDVFTVQDEIAAAVVAQLKVTLLGDAPKARQTDPKAYALYLQARALLHQYSPASIDQSLAVVQQALAIDPSYAPAWVMVAAIYWARMDLGIMQVAEALPAAKQALNKAIQADPSSAYAYSTLAMFEGILERDYPAAARHIERALALEPTNLDAVNTASSLARRLIRLDLAIDLAQYQVSRDPVNVDAYDALGLAYRYKGELQKSAAAYRTLLALAPESGWEHTALGNVLLQMGDADAALAEFGKEPVESFRLIGFAKAYHDLGRRADSEKVLAELKQKYAASRPYQVAVAVAYLGDVDTAFALIDKAVRLNDIDIGALPVYPDFKVLHDDPRWSPLLDRLGMAPQQLAAIRLDVTVPQ